ncbi:uncharacterized protein PHA67_015022 [Liasis olivaceus]
MSTGQKYLKHVLKSSPYTCLWLVNKPCQRAENPLIFAHQAICKRNELPRDPALLQAIDNIKAKMSEMEIFDNMDKKLKVSRQRENRRENAVQFGTEIQQVKQELQDVQGSNAKGRAQEFASLDEKLLMESSLKASQG